MDQQAMHFGKNCRHLIHDESHADGQCALAVERYAGPEYSFLDARTPVAIGVAAKLLSIGQDEMARRAKAGDFEYFYPKKVAKRVTVQTRKGLQKVTIREAAKLVHVDVKQIEQQVNDGTLVAKYPDRLMHIVLITRWEAERCPLLNTGGTCYHYENQISHKILRKSDAPRETGSDAPGPLFSGL